MNNASDFKQSADNFGISSRLKLPYGSIGFLVAPIDFIFLICVSLLSALSYQIYNNEPLHDFDIIFGMGATSALMFVFFSAELGFYRTAILMEHGKLLPRTVMTWFISFLIMIAILLVLRESTFASKGSTFLFAGSSTVSLVLLKLAICHRVRAGVALGEIVGRRAVTIGDEIELCEISSPNLLLNYGLREVARVILPKAQGQLISKESVLRCADLAVRASQARQAEEFVIAIDWRHSDVLELISQRLRASPLPVRLLPGKAINSIVGRTASATRSRYIFSLELHRAPLSRSERIIKRSLDLVLSALALLLLAPLLVMIAIAIRLDSSGPSIFRQRRAGFDGLQFIIYKFRSMKVLEDGPSIVQARQNDSRVTRLGRLLRKSSIDELPQLINVLLGDMSLVGPRPHALAHDDQYKSLLADYAFRHHVKPGITGWAQVNGSRGETVHISDMKQRLELDIWYINNWSLMLDCRIMLKTAFSLISSRAY